MWKLQALVVQLLLLGSLLSTYFQPTQLPGLVPQKTMSELGFKAPADRLVVFLIDGLSGITFLADNGSNVPDLRDLYRQHGRMAISHSTAPTMTRTGHIAIFGGLHEDPSAALVYYNYNPLHFDTVFNRSRTTIGWVHRYVNSFFKNLPHGGAPLRFTLFSEGSTGRLKCDTFVYRKVAEYLSNTENVQELRNTKPVVLFLYLPDMDIVGHRYTMQKPQYYQKLMHTQRGVRHTYELIERVFNDGRTSYLMTADHGQTIYGYHGQGSALETETPLLLWGAGVKRSADNSSGIFPTRQNIAQMDQIQLASLMSALIGLPPPMNNLGVIPEGYLDVSAPYEAMALHLNALQILEQAKILIRRHESAVFYEWLPFFWELDLEKIANYSAKVKALMEEGKPELAIKASRNMAKLAQECIGYYTDYYKFPLLVATTASFFIWSVCMLLQLTRLSMEEKEHREGYLKWPTLIAILLGIMALTVVVLQNVPLITGFYLLLPVGLFIMALAERGDQGNLINVPIAHLAFIMIPAGLLVLMVFTYQHLAVLYTALVCLHNRRAFRKPSIKFFVWLSMVVLMGGGLYLQQNPKKKFDVLSIQNNYLLHMGMLLALVRPVFLGHHHEPPVWIFNTITLMLGAYGAYQFEANTPVWNYVKATCWSFLVYAFLSIRYFSDKLPTAKGRLQLITLNMITLICLLSTSWGALLIQILVTEFVFGLELYEESKQVKDDGKVVADKEEEEEEQEEIAVEEELSYNPEGYLKQSYRYAFAILMYFYVAFVAAGHWVYGFQFVPTTARLFYSHISMALSGSFIILKIGLPAVIVIATLYALVPFARHNSRSIITCMLLISNVMSMYFCYFVGNEGSWWSLRRSLDKLMVCNVVTVILLACSCLAKFFLRNTTMGKDNTCLTEKEDKSVRLTSSDENCSA
ncbi:uncharacterized protein Dana_GF16287 [Drosophila ananassae]|uniref:GPI ethanolamine phosphate transferase 1 n=2 Tax=Drosophila ananassae TaxID=7217 RepID=B3LXK3_DROAN|nr:uncharacterized protein Dana_GF16287 [Drosophila ananassae]